MQKERKGCRVKRLDYCLRNTVKTVKGRIRIKNAQKVITRDFLLAFFAQFGLTMVVQLLVPTLPIYLKTLGSSEIEIGMLIGMLGLASLVSRPFVGSTLMNVREKSFIVAGAVLHALSCTAYLVIPPFWPLLLVRINQGIGFGFFHTASTIYAVNMSPISYRARVLGYFFLIGNLAGAIAPPVGMELVNRFGFTHFFLVCSAISLFMVFAASMLKRSDVPVDSGAVRKVFLSAKALPQSIVGFFVLFTWTSLITFFPLYARSQGVRNPGLFFTATAVMLILGRACGGRILDIVRKERVIFPCIILCIASMVILTFSRTQPMFLIVAVVWGVGHSFLIPCLLSYALERADSSGPVVSTFYAVSDIGTFLGPLVMGFVIRYTSYHTMFFCLSLVGVTNLLYFSFFVAQSKKTLLPVTG